jgi:hypothetical protein
VNRVDNVEQVRLSSPSQAGNYTITITLPGALTGAAQVYSLAVTGGTSVVMFGGGTKKGHVHGQTADERPLIAIKDPVTIMDLHATIMTAMGISPKTEFTIEGRPFYVTEDAKGQPVTDLFA